MKAIQTIGFFVVAAIFLATSNAHAVQVTYRVEQTGISGDFTFGVGESQPAFLNQFISTEVSNYQLTGSVNPDRAGLIGVSSGFSADTFQESPLDFPTSGIDGGFVDNGDFVDDGRLPDSDFGPPGGDAQPFGWNRIEVDTRAVGSFQTIAQINGLTDFNDIGFVEFEWAVTGSSSIFVDVVQEAGDVTVVEAGSLATLTPALLTQTPDSFIHLPTIGADGSINDTRPSVLEAETFTLPFDQIQLDDGEIPLIAVDFELSVETRFLATSNNQAGVFTSIFDANFSNTATLTRVTVLDNEGAPITRAEVVDRATGLSLVAVPEPSAAIVLLLAGSTYAIRRRRVS